MDMVFLDLDGVLVDIHAGFESHFGFDLTEEELTMSLGEVIHRRGLVAKNVSVWSELNMHWWANLPPYLNTAAIIERFIHLVGRDNVRIATACPNYHARAGKELWVEANTPLSKRQLINIHDKWLLSAPGRHLVDDKYDWCLKFRAYGGTAEFVERPWSYAQFSGVEVE